MVTGIAHSHRCVEFVALPIQIQFIKIRDKSELHFCNVRGTWLMELFNDMSTFKPFIATLHYSNMIQSQRRLNECLIQGVQNGPQHSIFSSCTHTHTHRHSFNPFFASRSFFYISLFVALNLELVQKLTDISR